MKSRTVLLIALAAILATLAAWPVQAQVLGSGTGMSL